MVQQDKGEKKQPQCYWEHPLCSLFASWLPLTSLSAKNAFPSLAATRQPAMDFLIKHAFFSCEGRIVSDPECCDATTSKNSVISLSDLCCFWQVAACCYT